MRLVANPNGASSKSRLSAHRLISMQLRILAVWRQTAGSHDDALVLMAVIAITGDRLSRNDRNSALHDMTIDVPPHLLGRCNISSIAAATGMHREKTRRIVHRLSERGVLERTSNKSINFAVEQLRDSFAAGISGVQFEEFVRTANTLVRDGVLNLQS